MSRILHAPIIGYARENTWAQVVVNPDHTVLCCCAVAGSAAHEFGEFLVQTVMSSRPSTTLEFFQTIETLIQKASELQLEIQLSSGVFFEEKCAFSAYNGSILLKRDSKVGQIVLAENELRVVEGSLKKSDIFVFFTKQANIYADEIKTQLPLIVDAEDFTSHFLPVVLQAEDSSQIAMAYVTMGEAVAVYQAPTMAVVSPQMTSQMANASETPHSPAPKKNLLQGLKKVWRDSLVSRRKLITFVKNAAEYPKSLFSHDVYVRKRSTKKAMRVVLPLIALVIVASVFLFIRRSQQAEQQKEAEAIVTPLNAKLETVRQEVQQNPIQARQDAQDVVDQYKAALTKFTNKKTAAAIIQKNLAAASDFSQNISGLQEQNVLPKFYDLLLAQPNFLANAFDIQDNTLVILDSGKKQLLALAIDTKQQTPLAVGDLPEIKDLTIVDKNVYLLGNGIQKFVLSSSQPAIQVRTAEDQNTGGVLMRSYGKNLYVLNPAQKNIFRYIADSDKVASSAAWLRTPQTLDLNTVSSMTIDGDVWLATKTGQVLRYTNGKSQDFPIIGMNTPFSSPLTLYTRDDLTNVYVLEPKQNRLVVLSKKGEFLREIKSPTLGAVTAIVAQEKINKVYALSGSLIYEVGL